MAVLAYLDLGAPFTTPPLGHDPSSGGVSLQANFTIGSASAIPATSTAVQAPSVSAWVQTTLDDGLTWSDAANFTFGATSERVLETVHPLESVSTPMTLTDGTLAANSSTETVLGPSWRVKYVVTGSYPTGTTLRIDIV